jgi:DNA-binding MarR family transcriptional regulator/N-acetylglutamate synthase-like GNAT family acetyltransferase
MVTTEFEQRVAFVRQFNRFYTQRIGVLAEGLLQTPFSLTEARVLYELANREKPVSSELARELGLDAGYVSRILRGFESRGMLEREPSQSDGRHRLLSLTAYGREMFAPLDARSREEVGAMLHELHESEQDRLVEAMQAIESILGRRRRTASAYLLRPPQAGDLGWVVQRHGAVYAQEYGWNEEFEALVAEVVASFIRNFDAPAERCWIAEKDQEKVGSVFVIRSSDTVAKLRLLLVEPSVRGLGIGRRLVDECLRFARQCGYKQMTLWTNSVLLAARRIYERAGFHMTAQESHHSFGCDLIGETWEIDL